MTTLELAKTSIVVGLLSDHISPYDIRWPGPKPTTAAWIAGECDRYSPWPFSVIIQLSTLSVELIKQHVLLWCFVSSPTIYKSVSLLHQFPNAIILYSNPKLQTNTVPTSFNLNMKPASIILAAFSAVTVASPSSLEARATACQKGSTYCGWYLIDQLGKSPSVVPKSIHIRSNAVHNRCFLIP